MPTMYTTQTKKARILPLLLQEPPPPSPHPFFKLAGLVLSAGGKAAYPTLLKSRRRDFRHVTTFRGKTATRLKNARATQCQWQVHARTAGACNINPFPAR